MDRAMKAKEVLEVLGICRTTLYYLGLDGSLPARKMRGNRLYYLQSEVDNYLKSLPYHNNKDENATYHQSQG